MESGRRGCCMIHTCRRRRRCWCTGSNYSRSTCSSRSTCRRRTPSAIGTGLGPDWSAVASDAPSGSPWDSPWGSPGPRGLPWRFSSGSNCCTSTFLRASLQTETPQSAGRQRKAIVVSNESSPVSPPGHAWMSMYECIMACVTCSCVHRVDVHNGGGQRTQRGNGAIQRGHACMAEAAGWDPGGAR